MSRGVRRLVALMWVLGTAGCAMPAGVARRPGETVGPGPAPGMYVARGHTRFAGAPQVMLELEPVRSGVIRGGTRRGVAWGLVGGFEAFVGPLFAPFLFPQGRILTWESTLPGHIDGEAVPGKGTLGVGSLPSLRIATRTRGIPGPTEVVFRDGRVLGAITIEPAGDAKTLQVDYVALVRRFEEVVTSRLFDAELAGSSRMRRFLRDLRDAAPRARDDLELLFALGVSARSHLKSSTPLVYRQGPDAESLAVLEQVKAGTSVRWRIDPKANVAVLRVDAFLDWAVVQRGLDELRAAAPAGLVLDLRTCPGVDLSALLLAAALIESPTEVGAYAGRDAVKDGSEIAQCIEITGVESVTKAQALLRTSGSVRLTVAPVADPWDVPMIVLIGPRTSSTAEALVDTLRRAQRVRAVLGAPTAGRPQLSDEFDVGQGWVARVAAYDFVPPGGFPASGKSVRPDRRLRPTDAMRAALRELSETGEFEPDPVWPDLDKPAQNPTAPPQGRQ